MPPHLHGISDTVFAYVAGIFPELVIGPVFRAQVVIGLCQRALCQKMVGRILAGDAEWNFLIGT